MTFYWCCCKSVSMIDNPKSFKALLNLLFLTRLDAVLLNQEKDSLLLLLQALCNVTKGGIHSQL